MKLISKDCCGQWLIDQKVRRTRDNGCEECGCVKDVEINDCGKICVVDFDGGERSFMRFDDAAKAAFKCLLDTYSDDTKLQWPESRDNYKNGNNMNKQQKSSKAPSKRKRKKPNQVDTEQNARELPRRERRKPDYFALASSSI